MCIRDRLCFFCYCALEQTAALWASSYLTVYKGISADTAASFAGLFFIGITVGRAICGLDVYKRQAFSFIKSRNAENTVLAVHAQMCIRDRRQVP